MATVGITKELRNRTKSVIESMRRAERRNDLPEIDNNITVDASYIYNLGGWGAENMHLIAQIPKDWLCRAEEGHMKLQGSVEGMTITTDVRFNGMKSAYYRPTENYYGRAAPGITIDQVRALPEQTIGRAELLKRWEDTLVAVDMDARWEKIKTDIDEFLDKCKSLNEAVKLFPGVRMYIHSEDIERLERKLERPTQRAKIVEDVDTEGLTAAAIAAKLAAAA
jgi:hypothetical protein